MKIQPNEDYGFFGPGSVTWKVWTYPTSLTVGFQRAVVVEELDPALVASVDHTQDIYKRPRTRYDRTIRYFALVAFGPSRETAKAADVLVKIHSKGIGIEPYGGQRYDANDPQSQLWILLTGWHSVLCAYERYGPGRLSDGEESQYWAECARAAEFQTIDPADVPRSRAEVREYFERMRPQLSASPIAKRAMNHLLHADAALPPVPAVLKPGGWVVSQVLRAGTLATLPRWMREMSDLNQPPLIDWLVRPVLWTSFHVVHASPRLEVLLLRLVSPSTVSIAAPVIMGIPPVNDEILTPAEARERYGFDKPADAHQRLRAAQREKVFGLGQAPSDEGLVESEAVLGHRFARGRATG